MDINKSDYLKKLREKNPVENTTVTNSKAENYLAKLREVSQVEKNNSLLTRANSWLSNSAGYFGVESDEYTPEYFKSRSKTASHLSGEGDRILSELKSIYGDAADEVKNFKSYYDRFKPYLDNSVKYYNQNPASFVGHGFTFDDYDKDGKVSIKDVTKIQLAAETPEERTQRYLNELSRYEADFAADKNAEKYIEAGKSKLGGLPEGMRTEDADFFYYLQGKADENVKTEIENNPQSFKGLGAKELISTVNKSGGKELRLANNMEGLYEKYKANKLLAEVDDIANSDAYKIGQRYIDGLENSIYHLNPIEGYENLIDEDIEKLTYLLGKRLQEKGYNETRADELSDDDILGQLEASGEIYDYVNIYIDSIKGERRQREAESDFEKVKGKHLLEIPTLLAYNLKEAPSGIYNSLSFGNMDLEKRRAEIFTELVSEDLADFGPKLPDALGGRSLGQAFGDAAASLGQMIPSMALSAIPVVGPALSSVAFGMSSGGNAKVELMREGYDEVTATSYGVLVGVAEAGLEKLMGGIPGLGEGWSDSITKGIKNAFLKAATNYGIKALGETVEESAQTILEPVFRRLSGIDKDEVEKIDWEEVAYSGFQGFLMAGTSNAPGTIKSAVVDSKSYTEKKANVGDIENVNSVIDEALSRNENSEIHKYAASIKDKMTKAYDKAIKKGKSEVEAQQAAAKTVTNGQYEFLFRSLSSTADIETSNAIKERLKELGVKDNIGTIASAVYKQNFINQYGAETAKKFDIELSRNQKKILNNSEYAKQVLSEYEAGEEAWVRDLYSSAEEATATKTSDLASVGIFTPTTPEAVKSAVAEITPSNAVVSEHYKSGIAAKRLSDSKTVGVVGVEYSDGNGEVIYKLSTGETAKGADIQFDDSFTDYVIQDAANSYSTQSANAMIKASTEYAAYAKEKGIMASSAKLRRSFDALSNAGLKGITYEQAANSTALSGDIRQIGTRAAQIALNDGLSQYYDAKAKAEAKAKAQAEKKKATPTRGKVTISEGIKLNKADNAILSKVAKDGNVAIVIERFSGADKESKGFYSGGIIHLNADKLSEGGFTYTAIHESVHYVADVNLEGYKVLRYFVEKYYKEKGVELEGEIKVTQEFYKSKGKNLSSEGALEEIICNTLSDIATDEDALTAFLGFNKAQQNKLIDILRSIAKKLKAWADKYLTHHEYHQTVINDADALLHLATELGTQMMAAGQKNNTADNSGVRYSLSSQSQAQISANMTDIQRSEILKTKNIVAPVYAGEADFSIENESDLASGRSRLVKSALIRIAEEFNVFTDYDVKDVDLRISLSKSNLKESVQKASEPKQLAKLMPILKETVENAIGIESHANRYYYDNATVSFDNLLGGYIDGEYFVPVRFGLKHVMGGKTVLYVVVDQQKIKAEVLKTTPQPKVGSTVSRSAYNYNLSQVIPFVNSKDLLRYLPDDMLSVEQKKIKQEGIAETIRYTNDKNDAKYAQFIADGNMQAAQDMVDAAAEFAMKDSKIRDYKNKLVKVYHGSDSADFYEFDKHRRGQTDSSMYGRGYYFAFDPDYSSDFGENIREFYLDIKNPYYIDINAPASKIANFLKSKGVDVDFDYSNMKSHYFAKNFGSQKFADTLADLGYDGVVARTDEGVNFEAVAFHRNQMKLADAVTYDDSGNIIPITERFNMKNNDVRYSFGEEDMDLGLYLSEDNGVSDNLKNSNSAMGAMLEKTAKAKADVFAVSRIVNKNLKIFGIVGDMTEANERVAEIIALTEKNKGVDGGEVVGEIAAVMKDAVKKSPYVVDNFAEEREDILSRMKGVGKIYLTADQIAMLEESDYSLNWFKQRMFGKITVVANPKIGENIESLNGLWHSLSEAYPAWFGADTLSDNMPLEMIRILERLKPQSVGADEFFMMSNDEVAIELANKVISDIIDLKYKKLSDEKLKAEVNKLKEKQSDNMKKWLLRKDAGDKLKSIERYAAGFYKKLIKPTKNDSIPEKLRKPMMEMLEGLDFSKGTLHNGKPIKHDKLWQQRMLVVADALENYGGLKTDPETSDITLVNDSVRGFEMDARLIADLRELSESGAKSVYKMSNEELLKLNNLMYRLRNEISQLNKLNANKYKAHVQDLGQATISELKTKGENRLLKSKANNLMFYSTADALTYFSQYGEAGMSVYRELREGYDKYILNLDKVRQFTERNLDEDRIRKWSKETFDFNLKSGERITLTVPQLMSLYCLDKRKQARGHLYENPDKRGRITVIDSKGNKKRVTVSNDDIIFMTAKLSDEQIKCAEKLQSFLENEVAEWGNEVTMRRYLYRAFTTKNYFPIKVDGVSIDTTDATASMASFYAVANPGFSKQTQQGAHKPLIIGDIFDVFTEHCGNMAMFNGMSEALSDAMRWYNFREGDVSVKEAIENAFSSEGQKWFETFIQDLNGRGQKASGADVAVKKIVGVTKSALIWGNMKVVLQQPTAYLRAISVLDIKYLTDPRVFKKGGVEKAMKYCPTAMYKSWGFYTTDVGKSARNLILNTGNAYDKVKDIGFWLAGKADELTWGRLWNACELQALDTNKKLQKGSEEFNKAVAELLTRVIDETQVVDTPFHRSQIRRNTSATSQLYSAFMDEPIKSYNMFMRAIMSGDGKKIARTAVAYTVTVVLGQALVKALWDMFVRYDWEDDEDGERKLDDFLKLYGKSVIDEMNPLNLHPLLSKLSGLGETILHNCFPDSPLFSDSSYGSGSLDTTAITDLTNLFNRGIKLIRGEDTNRTWYGYVYDISKVISDFSGIGVNRVIQDFVGLLNNFLPASSKVTKTEYSNTFVAKSAVNSLLSGNKADYELWHKELTERYKGDEKAVQNALGNALSKSGSILVTNAFEANASGNKAARDKAYGELQTLGFDYTVVKRGIESYESLYNSYVTKAAQARVDGKPKAEKEALDWIKEQEVFDDKYEDDIILKQSEIEEGALAEVEPEDAYDTEFLINALNNENMESFKEAYDELLRECETEEDENSLRSKVRAAVTKNYKLDYWLAYKDGDKAKIKEIEKTLKETELYEDEDTELWDTTKEWLKENIRAGYENAVSTENLEEMNYYKRMLLRSDIYSTDANARKALDNWRKAQQKKK